MAIVLGIDKFMSEVPRADQHRRQRRRLHRRCWWEGELDRKQLEANLNRSIDPSNLQTAVTTD